MRFGLNPWPLAHTCGGHALAHVHRVAAGRRLLEDVGGSSGGRPADRGAPRSPSLQQLQRRPPRAAAARRQ